MSDEIKHNNHDLVFFIGLLDLPEGDSWIFTFFFPLVLGLDSLAF